MAHLYPQLSKHRAQLSRQQCWEHELAASVLHSNERPNMDKTDQVGYERRSQYVLLLLYATLVVEQTEYGNAQPGEGE